MNGYHGEFIDMVGVELEGAGFTCGKETVGWHGDGSVNHDLGYDEDPEWDGNDHGEVASKPYKTWTGLRNWLEREYPRFKDETCGMHIHTSFRDPTHYMALAQPEFYTFFKQRMAKFVEKNRGNRTDNGHSRLASRFRGDNRYCQANFWPGVQITGLGERYTQLNFCWDKHGTLECRLLPMFDTIAEAIAAIRYVLNTYTMYLDSFDFSTLRFEDQTSVDDVDQATWDHHELPGYTGELNFTELPPAEAYSGLDLEWSESNVFSLSDNGAL